MVAGGPGRHIQPRAVDRLDHIVHRHRLRQVHRHGLAALRDLDLAPLDALPVVEIRKRQVPVEAPRDRLEGERLGRQGGHILVGVPAAEHLLARDQPVHQERVAPRHRRARRRGRQHRIVRARRPHRLEGELRPEGRRRRAERAELGVDVQVRRLLLLKLQDALLGQGPGAGLEGEELADQRRRINAAEQADTSSYPRHRSFSLCRAPCRPLHLPDGLRRRAEHQPARVPPTRPVQAAPPQGHQIHGPRRKNCAKHPLSLLLGCAGLCVLGLHTRSVACSRALRNTRATPNGHPRHSHRLSGATRSPRPVGSRTLRGSPVQRTAQVADATARTPQARRRTMTDQGPARDE